ncbi:exodeoxyribonuclease VII large subunit [soil metagenome]
MPATIEHDPETGELLAPVSNVTEFSVSEIAFALKRNIEDQFGHVRVRGEISGFRGPHASGHCYFCLKDQNAKLDAVVWRTTYARIRTRLQDGLEVIVTGKVTSYPAKSSYQIIIDTIEPAGIGALMAVLEERRRMLAAEGLFDAARKRPLPYLPAVIGVVTSPTGAVIRDILHRLSDRFPRRVIVWPVRVQGETAAAEIAAAILGFHGMAERPDLLIVARGGGSLEDLWSFNEEIVIRAVATCTIPLISAVGHETDTTLIDFVADHRAQTPTAAAERAVPVRSELLTSLASYNARHIRALRRLTDERHTRVRAAARALPRPDEILALARQRFDAASGRLAQSLRANIRHHRLDFARLEGRVSPAPLTRHMIDCRKNVARYGGRLASAATRHAARRREQMSACAKLLVSLSYKSVLHRGFALVRDDSGRPLRESASIRAGQALDIEFRDGRVAARAGSGPKSGKKPGPGQGSLF